MTQVAGAGELTASGAEAGIVRAQTVAATTSTILLLLAMMSASCPRTAVVALW